MVSPVARQREELTQMRSQLQADEIAEKNMRTSYSEELKKYLTQVEQFSEENLLLRFKKDELAQSQKVLERIMERKIALETEKGAPHRVALLGGPKYQVPPSRSSPTR